MRENLKVAILCISLLIIFSVVVLTMDYFISSKCPVWDRDLDGGFEFFEEPNFSCGELQDILSLELGDWEYRSPPKNQSYQKCNDGRKVNVMTHERYSLKEIYKNKCLGSSSKQSTHPEDSK